MTEPVELITAEEWQKHLFPFETGDDDIVYANGLELEPVIRDIQRNAEQHTLERAAQAVCLYCDQGLVVTRLARHEWRHRIASESTYCYASDIRDLTPETPAPTAGGR